MNKVNQLVVLLFFTLLGCGGSGEDDPNPSNEEGSPPVISSLTRTPLTNVSGDVFRITCLANDPDNDIESYDWSVSGGSFIKVEDNIIDWQSPDSEGSFTIMVEVTDSENNSVDRTIQIELETVPDTFETLLSGVFTEGNYKSLVVSIDEEHYVTLNETGNNGTRIVSLVKLDNTGNVVFKKHVKTGGVLEAELNDFIVTEDRHLIVSQAGTIRKISLEGSTIWEVSVQSSLHVRELPNGSFISVGSIRAENSSQDFAIDIISNEGVVLKHSELGTPEYDPPPLGLAVSENGLGVILGRSLEDDSKFYTMGVDNQGSQVFKNEHELNGVLGGAITSTSEGHFVISGFHADNSTGKYSSKTIMVDLQGNTIWSHNHETDRYRRPMSIKETSDGSIIIAGKTSFGQSQGRGFGFLNKLSTSGSELWYSEFSDDEVNAPESLGAESLYILPSDFMIISGIKGPSWERKVYVRKLNPTGGLD